MYNRKQSEQITKRMAHIAIAALFLLGLLCGCAGGKGVTVEAGVSSAGKPCHWINIAGKPGQKLYFNDEQIQQGYELVDTRTFSYRIDDELWVPYDIDPSLSEITVTPDVTLVDPDGTVTKLDVPPIVVMLQNGDPIASK